MAQTLYKHLFTADNFTPDTTRDTGRYVVWVLPTTVLRTAVYRNVFRQAIAGRKHH
jgi:hypothetical protein